MCFLKVNSVNLLTVLGLATLLLSMYGCQVTSAAKTGGQSGSSADIGRHFDSLDRNGDGQLERAEIPDSQRGLHSQFSRIDTNADGQLSREEISAISSRGAGPTATPTAGPTLSGQIGSMFERLDKNRDGELTLQEIPLENQGLRKYFDHIDSDGSGGLTRDEVSQIKANRQGASVPVVPSPVKPHSDDPWEQVRWQLDSQVANGALRGVGLAVFAPDGSLVFEHEAGDFRNDRWVPIASSTKWVTAAVIFTLIRDGLLDLSTTTGEVLGWQGDPARITVEQLLSFTSGFRGQHKCLGAVPIIDTAGEIVIPGEVKTLKQCAAQLYRDTATRPGSFSAPENDIFAYNGLHMMILGAMAEVVTGQSWEELYELRIRIPMGLDPNMSYVKSSRLGGNMVSNVDDFSKFLGYLYADSSLGDMSGPGLFPVELVDRSLNDQLTSRTRISFAPSKNYTVPQEMHYGFGTWVQCDNYADEQECNNNALVFSAGGYGWLPVIDKKNGFYGVLGMYETMRPGDRSGGEKAKLTFDIIRPYIARGMSASGDVVPVKLGSAGLSVPAGEVVRISPTGQSYVDPEVMQEYDKLTFMDGSRRVWVSDVDPVTGKFVSAKGMDLLIDSDHVDLKLTNTGPEYGLDRDGWSVVYTKKVADAMQVWSGRLDGKKVVAKPMTSGRSALGAVPSKNVSGDSTRILAVQGSWKKGDLIWVDFDKPAERHVLAPISDNTDARWVNDSNLAVSTLGGADYGQLALIDTDTGQVRRITDDAGSKTRPYGWFAPEAGDNRLRVLAIVDKTSLGVYEDKGSKYWERVMTMPIPAGTGGVSMSSPEPFVAAGRSYASMTVAITRRPPPDADAQIWIMDLSGSSAEPSSWRCDDADPTPAFRADPEAYIGSEQVFLYYSIYGRRGGVGIYRCATGIRTDR